MIKARKDLHSNPDHIALLSYAQKTLLRYKTFLKYLGLQVGVYILDLFIFAIALFFIPPAASQAVSKFLCGFISFFGLKNLVFKTPVKRSRHQGIKYFLLWLINIPVTAWGVGILFNLTEQAYISKIVVDIAAFILNYLIAKTLIFETKK